MFVTATLARLAGMRLTEVTGRRPRYFAPPSPGAASWGETVREGLIVVGVACAWAVVLFGLFLMVAEAHAAQPGQQRTFERMRMPAVPLRTPTAFACLESIATDGVISAIRPS